MPTLKPRNTATHSEEPRVLIQDVIPYEVAESLGALQGLGEGVLTLPHHVYWGPQADCDLGQAEGVFKAYQAILRDAGLGGADLSGADPFGDADPLRALADASLDDQDDVRSLPHHVGVDNPPGAPGSACSVPSKSNPFRR